MKKWLWSSGLIIFLILICVGVCSAATETFSFNTNPSNVPNGTTQAVTVKLTGSDVGGVGSFGYDVLYNPTVLRFSSYSVFPFSYPGTTNPTVNSVSGDFGVAWTSDGTSVIPLGVNNTCTITFMAIKGGGTSVLDLSSGPPQWSDI